MTGKCYVFSMLFIGIIGLLVIPIIIYLKFLIFSVLLQTLKTFL